MPKKKWDNPPPPPRHGHSTTAGGGAAAPTTSVLRSGHSSDAGGAVATSAASLTRKLCSVNTGVINVIGIDGATAEISYSGAAPVRGPGRGRSRINTGGGNDAGTGGAIETAAGSINFDGTADLGEGGVAAAITTAGAATVRGPGHGRSRINTGSGKDEGTGGAIKTADGSINFGGTSDLGEDGTAAAIKIKLLKNLQLYTLNCRHNSRLKCHMCNIQHGRRGQQIVVSSVISPEAS
jgi:hypothetical protein